MDLSHNEWFFRADKRFLADWIVAQDGPILIPISELNQPTLRALLLRTYPAFKAASAAYELPPQTQVIVPWLLETGANHEPAARLALLHEESIIALPALTVDARRQAFSNVEGALELVMPDSAYPAVARIQALAPGVYRLVAGAWYTNGPKLPAESFVDHATGGIASIGWVKVAQENAPALPAAGRPLGIEYAGQFLLEQIMSGSADGAVTVNLYWSALQKRPPIDATIFVHALSGRGELVAQDDGRTWGGRYPTFIWDAGEIVATRHRLELGAPTP